MSERAKEVAFDALREMYSEAEPPLDFDYALENPEEMNEDWYSQHHLDSDRQREIVNKHIDKRNLTDREENAVIFTAILDLGPANEKDNAH